MLAGRYRLEGPLAAGGMGAVHVATDERLGRRVAVKIMKEELASEPDFVERFRREASAAAGLSHQNIAQVYDYGQDGRQHFIVMELVEGTDLARLLREKGRLPAEDALRIAAQVCRALSVAHRAGIVHRDIKPANVIVTHNGDVKVTDFGIARTLGDSTLTNVGSVLGTAQYMSPEQARGEPAGPASDLYAVGVVLFQLLTGTVPFTGESAVAVALRHLNDEIPAPSSVVPGLPIGVDQVVARATEKDPEHRFSDADEMAVALDKALLAPEHTAPEHTAPLPAAAPHREVPSGAPSPDGRRRLPWILAAVALAAAVAILFAVTRDGEETTAQPNPSPSLSSEPSRTPTKPARSKSAEPTPTPTPQATQPSGPVVPENLVGQDKKSAEEALKSSGYDVKTVDVESAQPKESVVASLPAPGTPVSPGQTIVLLNSNGKSAEDSPAYVVPTESTGAHVHDVEDALRQDGIEVEKVSVDSAAPKDSVITTYPAPGESTRTGEVVLLVSTGHPDD